MNSDWFYGSMDHIIDDIWIGDEDSAANLSMLKMNSISAILCVQDNDQYRSLYPTDWRFLHLILYDQEQISDEVFEESLEFIQNCRKEQHRILVHCSAGQSRSPSIVAAYLMSSKGMNPYQALAFMQKRREDIDPAKECYRSTIKFCFPHKSWRCRTCGRQWIYTRDRYKNPRNCVCTIPHL
ncbi:MAG: dual specificity protein phosphatase family protein [Candidatus Heimdallarchaeota archaeon]|nr:MAG: dual specificity protein phosphatase family protein [Candidatus Heimdallarchaeota archaeon]